MGKKRIRKAVVGRAQAWSSYEQTKETTKSLKDFILRLIVPQRARHPENLVEAMQRLGLTPSDIRDRKRSFKRLAMITLLITLGVLAYATYFLISQHWLVAGITLLLSGIPLMLAFRYHFWYFQLKKGKLGCTLQEWFTQGVLGKK